MYSQLASKLKIVKVYWKNSFDWKYIEMAQAASQASDFEAAIAECGFGLFNVFIMLCSIPCLTAMVFSASAISYIMPTAECDLKLTLMDKGLMNAVTYAGRAKGCGAVVATLIELITTRRYDTFGNTLGICCRYYGTSLGTHFRRLDGWLLCAVRRNESELSPTDGLQVLRWTLVGMHAIRLWPILILLPSALRPAAFVVRSRWSSAIWPSFTA